MERNIYQCPVTQRFYDPLAVRRKILRYPGFNNLVADREREALTDAARVVLDLPPIDPVTGLGFTEDEAYSSLSLFTEYLEGKDGTAQNSPTPAPCSECPPGPTTPISSASS